MTVLDSAPEDLVEVETLVRKAGTSFYRGMRVLPPDRRMGMYAIYAFCRTVDDIADEPGTIAAKRDALDGWRTAIGAIYEGHADSGLTRLLLRARERFDLRQEDFLAVIDGMQMDAEDSIVAPDLALFDLYCDRVASAVGRLSVRVFGDTSPAADRVAYHLGRALQQTNILRDLSEDAERGRLYLPREWLIEEDIPCTTDAALSAKGLPRVCHRLVSMAREHFTAADHAMQECNPKAMKPARLMSATYRALLARLEQGGFTHPEIRVGLPNWEKAWLALRFLFS